MTSNSKNTIKFNYSYGGKILLRRSDGQLWYSGGHTRVLTLHPPFSFSELMVKFVELCGSKVTLKCPLPNGDFETLISITNDEDLKNIIEEYDRASSSLPHPLKIKVILSPPKSINKLTTPPSASSSQTHSAQSSSHYASAKSLPYAVVHQFICKNCSLQVSVGYPSGIRNGAGKCSCYPGRLNGGPRLRHRFCNNRCH